MKPVSGVFSQKSIDGMMLITCSFCDLKYLSAADTLHIIFKGVVPKAYIIKLRNMIDGLAESLEIENLILDFTECEQAHFDYNSKARIAFWENLKARGLSRALLIIPPKYFGSSSLSCWESFFNHHNLDINVSAMSDRKLIPLFVLNKELNTL